MKKLLTIVAVLTVAVALAQAAFVQPTADQVKDAAKDPAKLTVLLKDATDEQVASVLADVLAAVADLKLDQKELDARVRALIAKAMEGRSDASRVAIARLLDAKLAGRSGVGAILGIVRGLLLPPRLGAGGPPPLAPRYIGQ